MIRLYPGGDTSIQKLVHWIDPSRYDSAKILWIDSNMHTPVDLASPVLDGVEQVYFYDFFHAPEMLENRAVQRVKIVAEQIPTTWYTCNAKYIPGINSQRFDYLWNRTKWVTLEGQCSWKHASDARAYQRTQLHWRPRTKKYLGLNRCVNAFRKELIQTLRSYEGYISECGQGQVLGNPYVSDEQIKRGITVPPGAEYFDNSYISCQVESQHTGTNSVIFTEKTYDHLIRGRIVLNFGPVGYYEYLKKDGWQLPVGVDLDWDSISNDQKRFASYIKMLEQLLSWPVSQLQNWFLENKSVIEHNYNMLETKAYDRIN